MSEPVYELNYDGTLGTMGIRMALSRREVPSVVRNGYDFDGWYTEPECIHKVDPDVWGSETYYAGWKPWDEDRRAVIQEYESALLEARYITARPKAYTWESFVPYYRAANILMFAYEADNKPVDDEAMELVRSLPKLKEGLVQVAEPEDTVWYIWGDRMPEAPDADSYDYYYCFDYKGFKPFLIPYMLPDQSRVKGNVIVVAGGGFAQRWNQTEGYPMAEEFNKLGYNAFVLQRRVEPSTHEDAFLDLQRAIRYIRFHAEEYGIAKIEHIATAGFSGGGSTIVGQIENCYGHVKPDAIYPDYVPDEIDELDSDYEVAMPIYGGWCPDPAKTENRNFPSIFAAVGARDHLQPGRRMERLFFDYLYTNPEIDMELHVFAGTPHGFGTGKGVGPEHHIDGPAFYGADNWMKLADDFMNVRFGYVPQTYKRGERPEPVL